VLDGKFTASGHLEAGFGQYLAIGPSALWLLPVRGNPVLDPQHPSPSAEKVRERPLPLLVPRLGPVRPAQRHASARFQPAEEPPGDLVTAEPVEGVADDGQFEVPGFRVEGLGVRRDRADVPGAQLVGLGLDHLREVGFPVHGPDFREGPAQREGELAGTAGQVKQPSRPGGPGARDQVLDHCLRVWQPVAVVILGGPLVEVDREVQPVVHGPQPFRYRLTHMFLHDARPLWRLTGAGRRGHRGAAR